MVKARRFVVVVLGALLGSVLTASPAAAAEGTVETGQVAMSAAGPIDYTVYLPPGYGAEPERRYPTVYLLHGRGDTQAAWLAVQDDLDELITSGAIQPVIAVLPDAPWSDGASWYVDSQFSGTDAVPAGNAVETALTRDLVAHVDATYRSVAHRDARAVGGYSMGGYGALRYVTAHPDVFSGGILISPAVYAPGPPADSSLREYGAFGVGTRLFDGDRYTELTYPVSFAGVDVGLPVHLYIDVGDDEWAHPTEPEHDLDLEAAQLYTAARRVPGITAELRIRDGGHDWGVWEPAFREGIVDVAARLRTELTPPFDGVTAGSGGDDRAGGITEAAGGRSVVALNLDGEWDGYTPAGGMDALVVGRDAAGSPVWSHAVATSATDRAYGVVGGTDGGVIVAGYTRGDLDGNHAGSSRDDGFVVGVDADGNRTWTLQAGDPNAADRLYALASDGAGGAYVAGYTSGTMDGANAGDKDAVLGRISPDGEAIWWRQLGGAGEDKALAVTALADGSVAVGGVSGGGLPGAAHAGGLDGWVARYSPDGALEWVQGVATARNDQVNALAARPDGSLVAVGHTRGDIGGPGNGDNDVFVRALGPDGATLWSTQVGTATDDRGVAVLSRADGGAFVAATTYGAMGTPIGGVDVAVFAVAADGTAGTATQFGSRERDGADEWDDANLYLAAGAGDRVWVSGLTYGATDGGSNAGGGDVFVTTQEWATGDDPGEGNGGPGNGVDPGGLGDDGDDAGLLVGGRPDASAPGPDRSSGPPVLAWTGSDIAVVAGVGIALVLGGAGLRRVYRNRTRDYVAS